MPLEDRTLLMYVVESRERACVCVDKDLNEKDAFWSGQSLDPKLRDSSGIPSRLNRLYWLMLAKANRIVRIDNETSKRFNTKDSF